MLAQVIKSILRCTCIARAKRWVLQHSWSTGPAQLEYRRTLLKVRTENRNIATTETNDNQNLNLEVATPETLNLETEIHEALKYDTLKFDSYMLAERRWQERP